MNRDDMIEEIAILEEIEERQRDNIRFSTFDGLYPWQFEFIASSKDHHESCLVAANQIGKTWMGVLVDAFHLTGDYPDDWPGHRFDHAPTMWGLGFSMEKTRDLLQAALFGRFVDGAFGGGLVPKDLIVAKGWESATGTPNSYRSIQVHHVSGKSSKMMFWSYSQGQHAIMGDVVDFVHVDEEPRDQSIRPQILTRTINGDHGRGGRVMYTFTPENGRTDLVLQFMDHASESQFYMNKGWSDAPHMSKEKRERLLAQYPAHQRAMRSQGVPMLGHGRIYDISEDFIECDRFEIPSHFKMICGMDFGFDHPQAFVQLAVDMDSDTYYLTHCWKAAKVSANDAWGATKPWTDGVPVAWPHDGLQHEKGRDDNLMQKDHYSKAGFNLLPKHSTWVEGGNSVETGLYLLNDLMAKGKFKVFRGNEDWLAEFRQYHRAENGKIVKVRDDLLDATRYAFMMSRYAIAKGTVGRRVKPRVMRSVG